MPAYIRSRQSGHIRIRSVLVLREYTKDENFAEAQLASRGRASGAARDKPRQIRYEQNKAAV